MSYINDFSEGRGLFIPTFSQPIFRYYQKICLLLMALLLFYEAVLLLGLMYACISFLSLFLFYSSWPAVSFYFKSTSEKLRISCQNNDLPMVEKLIGSVVEKDKEVLIGQAMQEAMPYCAHDVMEYLYNTSHAMTMGYKRIIKGTMDIIYFLCFPVELMHCYV